MHLFFATLVLLAATQAVPVHQFRVVMEDGELVLVQVGGGPIEKRDQRRFQDLADECGDHIRNDMPFDIVQSALYDDNLVAKEVVHGIQMACIRAALNAKR